MAKDLSEIKLSVGNNLKLNLEDKKIGKLLIAGNTINFFGFVKDGNLDFMSMGDEDRKRYLWLLKRAIEKTEIYVIGEIEEKEHYIELFDVMGQQGVRVNWKYMETFVPKDYLKIVEKIKNMKFDVCVMNPPYDKSLHLKFLEDAINMSHEVITIQPCEWLVRPYIKQSWEKTKQKYKGSIGNALKTLDVIESNNNFDAGIDTYLGIFYLAKDHNNFDYYDKFSDNYDIFYKNCIKRFKLNESIKDNIKKYSNDIKCFVPIRTDGIFERWWTLQLINYLDIIVDNKVYSGEYKGLTIVEARIKNPHENPRNVNRDTLGIEFNSLNAALNFRNSLKLEAYLVIIALLKTSRGNPLDKLPMLPSYENEWTNDKIFDLFSIDEKYRKEIINLMQPFMAKSKGFGNKLYETQDILKKLLIDFI